MAQSQSLIHSLKKALKAHGLVYRDVADGLGLSEASVKRLFAEQNFSLLRLEQICQLLGMEISDLVKQMESQEQRLSELSEEQEQELVKDTRLLLVAYLVVNGHRFGEITELYDLSETDTIRYLAKLDRLKLIELLPNNRIRLRISPKFAWRRNGPIQRFFTENLQQDFLKSRFDSTQELFQFPSGMLSRASSELFVRRIKLLIQEFHALIEQDRDLPLRERYVYSLLLAFRPWKPGAFEEFRRKQ